MKDSKTSYCVNERSVEMERMQWLTELKIITAFIQTYRVFLPENWFLFLDIYTMVLNVNWRGP